MNMRPINVILSQPGINIRLSGGNIPEVDGISSVTNFAGVAGFPEIPEQAQINLFTDSPHQPYPGGVVVDIPPTGGVEIWIKQHKGPTLPYQVIMPQHKPAPGPDPGPASNLPIIHVEGTRLVDATGREWFMRGVTEFSLLWRFMNGEDIAPILDERAGLGANTLRVLGMVSWLPGFTPQQHPDYYDRVPAFVDRCGAGGLGVELVALADAQFCMPNQADQLDHWAKLGACLAGRPSLFLQVANQSKKNGVDTLAFPKLANILCSRDNPMEADNPPMPPLDYSSYCSSRSYPKGMVEVGSSMWYIVNGWGDGTWGGTHQPSILTEPIGADEVESDGRRWSDPARFETLAKSTAMAGSGAVFHSTNGANSVLYQPVTKACAVAWFAGLTSVGR